MEHMHGIIVKHLQGYAEYDIVKSACDIAKDIPVILLVLLLHHFSSDHHQNIYPKTSSKLIDIFHLQENIVHELCHSLLFIHALTVCDTTSRPYALWYSRTVIKDGKINTAGGDLSMAIKLH